MEPFFVYLELATVASAAKKQTRLINLTQITEMVWDENAETTAIYLANNSLSNSQSFKVRPEEIQEMLTGGAYIHSVPVVEGEEEEEPAESEEDETPDKEEGKDEETEA